MSKVVGIGDGEHSTGKCTWTRLLNRHHCHHDHAVSDSQPVDHSNLHLQLTRETAIDTAIIEKDLPIGAAGCDPVTALRDVQDLQNYQIIL